MVNSGLLCQLKKTPISTNVKIFRIYVGSTLVLKIFKVRQLFMSHGTKTRDLIFSFYTTFFPTENLQLNQI